MRPIEEVHPELLHYTSIAGLRCILESRELWGTHARFLNDGAELIAFKEYLPRIIRRSVRKGLTDLLQAQPGRQAVVDRFGGLEATIDEVIRGLIQGLYSATLGESDPEPFAEPYITSFCTPTTQRQAEHGLLSQWRGYGKEGGYALVFDTAQLSKAMDEEGKRWPNLFLFGGDVLYSDANDDEIQAEFGQNLKAISEGFDRWLATSGKDAAALEPIYLNILFVSCRYKHWGFSEEREVRIVAVPPNSQIIDEMKRRRENPSVMPIHHIERNGQRVPTIHLFDSYKADGHSLPIRRIIVGPGGDRAARKSMVEGLASACNLEIPVTVSEIPYIYR